MSVADLIFVVVALLAAIRGLQRGLVAQVFEFGGGCVGLVTGIVLGPRIAMAVSPEGGPEAIVVSLITIFVALSVGQGVGYAIGRRGGLLARKVHLGGVDSLLGAASGIGVTVVVFWLIASLLVQAPWTGVAGAVRRSRVYALTGEMLPDPPRVVAQLRHLFDTSPFPQVFAGLPRRIGPPVELPSNRLARRAALRAKGSVVRVVAPGCGGLRQGSGWISDEGIVITNAHVVAGGGSVQVESSDGAHRGVVVLFDPGTDVAVVRAPDLAGDPLRLSTGTLGRSSPGATLGFPGERDGRLIIHRAAVQDVYDATGLDIYGRKPVTRQVYELRSPVRGGDSGGPFVLPDGTVAGTIFAASTSNEGTGYALTGAEIADEVRSASRLSDPVSTGPCTS
ncbi:MAG: MarP family serine protease [Actinomycetota bacterium]|nr:MarP family serine protease [Actinomycetota bacterium]